MIMQSRVKCVQFSLMCLCLSLGSPYCVVFQHFCGSCVCVGLRRGKWSNKHSEHSKRRPRTMPCNAPLFQHALLPAKPMFSGDCLRRAAVRQGNKRGRGGLASGGRVGNQRERECERRKKQQPAGGREEGRIGRRSLSTCPTSCFSLNFIRNVWKCVE